MTGLLEKFDSLPAIAQDAVGSLLAIASCVAVAWAAAPFI